MAFIALYSLVFSLGVNDLIKSAVIAHFWRRAQSG